MIKGRVGMIIAVVSVECVCYTFISAAHCKLLCSEAAFDNLLFLVHKYAFEMFNFERSSPTSQEELNSHCYWSTLSIAFWFQTLAHKHKRMDLAVVSDRRLCFKNALFHLRQRSLFEWQQENLGMKLKCRFKQKFNVFRG